MGVDAQHRFVVATIIDCRMPGLTVGACAKGG
jgi:hypothetical protein